MVDYALRSKPRITEAIFIRVLTSAGSPAAPEAAACWAAIVRHGIDPALALAQFDKESTYGKFGLAAGNKSWGNIKQGGSFAKFTSWAAGADAYAALLTGPLYAGSNHYNTARTMPYRYAPQADHNAPAAYGAFLVAMIQHYVSLVPSSAVWYTVVAGDSLWKIAQRYRTTVAALLTLNPSYVSHPNLIHPGDKIRVK